MLKFKLFKEMPDGIKRYFNIYRKLGYFKCE